MADVLRGKFGARRDKYQAQETGEPPDAPDIERPPDHLPRPGPDNERIDTGQDVDDDGEPSKRDRPLPM